MVINLHVCKLRSVYHTDSSAVGVLPSQLPNQDLRFCMPLSYYMHMIAVDQLVCHLKPYVPNNPSMYVLNVPFMHAPNITFKVDDLNELLQHICFGCEGQQ